MGAMFRVFLTIMGFCFALPTLAQDDTSTLPETTVEQGAAIATVIDGSDLSDGEKAAVAWSVVAKAAEEIVKREDASPFALNRFRVQLLEWRDAFLSRQGINAERIATLDAQIAALGPDPASDDTLPAEAPEITERRNTLRDQRAELAAPAQLAAEGLAQANGLILELDHRISKIEREELTTRGPTPLNPVYWGPAFASLSESISGWGQEGGAGFLARLRNGSLERVLPGALLLIGIALWIAFKSRGWLKSWRASVIATQSRWKPIQDFFIEFFKLALPLLALTLFVYGIRRLGIFGVVGNPILVALASAATISIFARWLGAEFFPHGEATGPLNYGREDRAVFRRLTFLLGLGIAGLTVFEVLMSTVDAENISIGVILFPINFLAAIALFRFGRKLRETKQITETEETTGRIRRYVGFLCMLVAVAVPLLIAAGFSLASNALFRPFVLSLALVGFMMLLHVQISRSWSLYRGRTEDQSDALAPVLIGFVLTLVALPLLALVWGASTSDLAEWWGRFQSGITVGDTTVSPSEFVSFVLVFIIGYVITGFVQSFLKTTILPRTSIDIGARNAILAGVGYVGIMLAAIFAINSAGIDLTSIALVAGALSVGIGFGLQNIVSNFVSGIILLIERPVSEGDWIEVNGHTGYVRRISVRSTQIETFDRTDVIIPNADLASGAVTNWTRGNSVGRVIIPVGVSYGSDTEKVMSILKDVAMKHPMVLHYPEPSVLFMSFGSSSLDFEVRAILRDVNFILSVKSEMNMEISKRFEEEGIEIPFPQRDLWVRNAQDLTSGGKE